MVRTGAPAGPCHRALQAAEGDLDRAAALLVDWPRQPLALPTKSSFEIEMTFGQPVTIPAGTLKAGTRLHIESVVRVKLFDKMTTPVVVPEPLPDGKW